MKLLPAGLTFLTAFLVSKLKWAIFSNSFSGKYFTPVGMRLGPLNLESKFYVGGYDTYNMKLLPAGQTFLTAFLVSILLQ